MQIKSNRHLSYKHMLVISFTLSFVAIFLAGCATTADKLDKLTLAARGYEKALRWSKFDMAYSFFKWETGEQPVVPEELKSIRITKYLVANRKFDEDTMTAEQVVTIHYYHQSDLRERELEDHQKWKFFKEEERWYLTSKPPEFK